MTATIYREIYQTDISTVLIVDAVRLDLWIDFIETSWDNLNSCHGRKFT